MALPQTCKRMAHRARLFLEDPNLLSIEDIRLRQRLVDHQFTCPKCFEVLEYATKVEEWAYQTTRERAHAS